MNKFITVDELADCLHTTPGTVYSWKSMGVIPEECVMKIGRKLLFIPQEIDKWLSSLQRQKTAQKAILGPQLGTK